jgi:GTP-binding protein Era
MNETKAGFVALIGRPNAGKSTLLNWLLGEKISLVSQKANATRKRLNAIVMHNDDQIIFTDTPGLHEREKLLDTYMLEEALKAIGDCDLILYLAPVTDSPKEYEKFLELAKGRQHLLLLTKVDHVDNARLLKTITSYLPYQEKFLDLIPVSSTKGIGSKELLDTIVKYLPTSPYLFDPDDITTEFIRDIYKEFIRESIFEFISDEIPYATDVIIDKIDEQPNLERINATIIVEKESQKRIIIGKSGSAIKRIGQASRKKIEHLAQKRTYLDLFVSVKKGWSTNKKMLEDIGYIS